MPNILLYSLRTNEVQEKSGLNWGLSKGNVNNSDAYLALTQFFLRNHPDFFPSHGAIINAIWDDGTTMQLLLEGTQEFNNEIKPKQISTYKDKSILGIYLRDRLGVSQTKKITRLDLQLYGRESILVSFDHNRQIYIFDFSV